MGWMSRRACWLRSWSGTARHARGVGWGGIPPPSRGHRGGQCRYPPEVSPLPVGRLPWRHSCSPVPPAPRSRQPAARRQLLAHAATTPASRQPPAARRHHQRHQRAARSSRSRASAAHAGSSYRSPPPAPRPHAHDRHQRAATSQRHDGTRHHHDGAHARPGTPPSSQTAPPPWGTGGGQAKKTAGSFSNLRKARVSRADRVKTALSDGFSGVFGAGDGYEVMPVGRGP